MPALRFGGHRALSIEVHQVGQDRLRAVLPQHRGDLAAMVGAVIDQVLHGLPERILIDAEVQCLVFHDPIEIGLRQPRHESEKL